MMLKKRSLFLSLLLAACLVFSLPLQAGAAWNQFHGDGAHVGVSTATVPTSPSLIWMSGSWSDDDKTYEAVPSTSVVEGVYGGDTRIFVSCKVTSGGSADEGGLVCLDADDGALEWVAGGVFKNNYYDSWASPTYYDGRVYLSGESVYCFDWSGNSVWAYDHASDATHEDWDYGVNGGPVVYEFSDDGKKVVIAGDWTGDSGGEYHFIDDRTGDPLGYFKPPTSMYCQGTPAVDDSVYCYLTAWPYGNGHVWKVPIPDPDDGFHDKDHLLDSVWDVQTTYDTCGSPTYYDGRVYVTTYNFGGDGQLYAIDAGNGDVKWHRDDIQRTDATPAVQTVNDNTYIYLGGGCDGYSDMQTCCVRDDGNSYTNVWSTNANDWYGNWTCSTAVGGNYVFTGKPGPGGYYFDYDGIYALSKTTGAKAWGFNHGGASPAVTADGKVLTIGEGRVYCFGASPYSLTQITADDFDDGTCTNTAVNGSGDEGAVELQTSSTGDTLMVGLTGTGSTVSIYTYSSSDYQVAAQTFKATASGRLSRLKLKLQKVGNPSNGLRVQIRQASSATAPGSEILAEETLAPGEDFPDDSLTEKEVAFDKVVNLVSGQYYDVYLQVSSGGANNDSSNCYRWEYGTNDPAYTDGNKFTSTNGGQNWTTDSTNDFYLKVYTGSQYVSSGDFISEALYTGDGTTPSYKNIYFDADQPANTEIKFRLRSASTEQGLGSAIWYGPDGDPDAYYTASGDEITEEHEGNRYIQYKAYLTTTASGLTPSLDDFFITYTTS